MGLTDSIAENVLMYEQRQEKDIAKWDMKKVCKRFYYISRPVLMIAGKEAYSNLIGMDAKIKDTQERGYQTKKMQQEKIQNEKALSSITQTLLALDEVYYADCGRFSYENFLGMADTYNKVKGLVKKLTEAKYKAVISLFQGIIPLE